MWWPVAPAANAAPTTTAASAPTGTQSLAAVLTADGDDFDRNWYDYEQWQGIATLLREDDKELLRQHRAPRRGVGLPRGLVDQPRRQADGVARGAARRRALWFPVTQQLIDEGYVVVDISREGFDDKPGHSGDSLVRGTLSN